MPFASGGERGLIEVNSYGKRPNRWSMHDSVLNNMAPQHVNKNGVPIHNESKPETHQYITLKHFKSPNPNSFPKNPTDFYRESKEVASWHNSIFKLGGIRDEPTIPTLDKDLSELGRNNTIDYKRKFLGADLYLDHQNHKPMTAELLEDISPCIQYCNEAPSEKSKIIISPRHHIVDLIMSFFHDDGFSIVCTHFDNGKLLFSFDSSRKPSRVNKNDVMLKKIMYSGIALERELTHKNSLPYFSIVEASVDSDTGILLRCEMDAINELKDTYTELKCFGKLNFNNIHHRRKMLKTWVQISLIPQSDLIVGLRDQGGILRDLLHFSRKDLYADLSNPSLPRNRRYGNFNPNIAVAWFHHCIDAIVSSIMKNSKNSREPESFKVDIENRGTIKLVKLDKVPQLAESMLRKHKCTHS